MVSLTVKLLGELMATITPGTDGTLKSTTLENALHEALLRCISYELDTAKNPLVTRNIVMSCDFAQNKVTGSFSFGLLVSIDSTTGTSTNTILEYLTNSGYLPGTGGTIKSAIISAAIVEIAERIQILDRNSLKNPTAKNTITGLTYDSEANTVSGNFEYELSVVLGASGVSTITAKTYLLD